jgi:AcrR family transcriptional regulator
MKGYSGTRLSDVAAAANTQTGSLYYHFKSREELVEEVLRVGQERTSGFVRRRVAALPHHASPLDRLAEAIRAHLQSALETSDYTAAMIRLIGQVPEEIRARRVHEQAEYANFWKDLLNDTLASGEIRDDLNLAALRMFLLGAMNSSSDWFRPRAVGLSAAEFESHFMAVFLDGMATSRGAEHQRLDVEFSSVESAAAKVEPTEGLTVGAVKILDAAAKVFFAQGYSGTRLADIAAMAGMQIGSIYHYFESREALLLQLLLIAWDHTSELVRISVAELPESAPPISRFRAAITAHLMAGISGGNYTSALVRIYSQVPPEVRKKTAEYEAGHSRFLSSLLHDAVLAGEIRPDLDHSIVITMVTGALNWVGEWYRPSGTLTAEQVASEFTTLVLDGLIRHSNERPDPSPSTVAPTQEGNHRLLP